MMGAIVFALMSACSNDEPNIPDYYCPLNFKDSKNVWLER